MKISITALLKNTYQIQSLCLRKNCISKVFSFCLTNKTNHNLV